MWTALYTIQAALSPGDTSRNTVQAAKGQHLALVADRAARRGNVQVLGGISLGKPSTLLLCFFLVTLSRPPISSSKLPRHRSRYPKTFARQILAKSSPSNLLHILSLRTGSGASKVPPAKVIVLRSVESRNFRKIDPEK